jgi:hypothetical protein
VNPFPVYSLLIVILFLGHAFGLATLIVPTGVRSIAMGSCGYALSDDEMSLFYNPAGLGLKNERWNGGALYYSAIQYYGAASYYGIAYQNENAPNLGYSIYLNQYGATNNPYENTVSTGAGYNFYSNDFVENAIGVAVKYLHYYYGYDSWKDEAHTSPVAFDVGYVLQMLNRIRLGFAIKNLGPDITETINDSMTNRFRMPFMIATGCGYKDAFNFENLRVLDLSAEISFANLNQYYSRNENTIQTGIDLQFFRIFSVQFGYSKDLNGNLYNVSWGTGFSLFNHFDFNFVWAEDHRSDPYYNEVQMGISTAFKRMLKWSSKDRRWWLE